MILLPLELRASSWPFASRSDKTGNDRGLTNIAIIRWVLDLDLVVVIIMVMIVIIIK